MKPFEKFLTQFLIVTFVILFSACTAIAPSPGNAPSPPTVATVPAATTGTETVDVYSTWGPGAELDALGALENVYRKQNPNFEVTHNLTGGGGANTDENLLDLLRREQPPDSFVIHAGEESRDYVNRGQLEPITKLFQAEGLDRVMPQLLLEQLNIKGEIYTVPVNIQRSNVLWYNPKVFQANNVQPPRTLEDFFTVAEKLKAKGIIPLAIGGGFELGHAFESVLVATYGPDDFVRLVNGDPVIWADARLTTAIHTFKKMLDNSNSDRASEWWQGAAQRVLEGKAGMTVMGDWTEGDYKEEGAKLNTDFGWAAAPGTGGTFIWLSDSFALAKGAPHREAAIAFLKTVGSREGQDAFNPIKGSIPARIDANRSLYDEYLQWSVDQFHSDKLVPSIVGGAATPDSFRSAYSRAMIDFSGDLNEQALAEALRGAALELTE